MKKECLSLFVILGVFVLIISISIVNAADCINSDEIKCSYKNDCTGKEQTIICEKSVITCPKTLNEALLNINCVKIQCECSGNSVICKTEVGKIVSETPCGVCKICSNEEFLVDSCSADSSSLTESSNEIKPRCVSVAEGTPCGGDSNQDTSDSCECCDSTKPQETVNVCGYTGGSTATSVSTESLGCVAQPKPCVECETCIDPYAQTNQDIISSCSTSTTGQPDSSGQQPATSPDAQAKLYKALNEITAEDIKNWLEVIKKGLKYPPTTAEDIEKYFKAAAIAILVKQASPEMSSVPAFAPGIAGTDNNIMYLRLLIEQYKNKAGYKEEKYNEANKVLINLYIHSALDELKNPDSNKGLEYLNEANKLLSDVFKGNAEKIGGDISTTLNLANGAYYMKYGNEIPSQYRYLGFARRGFVFALRDAENNERKVKVQGILLDAMTMALNKARDEAIEWLKKEFPKPDQGMVSAMECLQKLMKNVVSKCDVSKNPNIDIENLILNIRKGCRIAGPGETEVEKAVYKKLVPILKYLKGLEILKSMLTINNDASVIKNYCGLIINKLPIFYESELEENRYQRLKIIRDKISKDANYVYNKVLSGYTDEQLKVCSKKVNENNIECNEITGLREAADSACKLHDVKVMTSEGSALGNSQFQFIDNPDKTPYKALSENDIAQLSGLSLYQSSMTLLNIAGIGAGAQAYYRAGFELAKIAKVTAMLGGFIALGETANYALISTLGPEIGGFAGEIANAAFFVAGALLASPNLKTKTFAIEENGKLKLVQWFPNNEARAEFVTKNKGAKLDANGDIIGANGRKISTKVGAEPINGKELSQAKLKALGEEMKKCEKETTGCFLADTLIKMADGTYKNIQDILVGEKVTAFDITNNKPGNAEVTTTFKRPADKYFEVSYEIEN